MPNQGTVLTAVAALNANQTALLFQALTRTPANRDVVRMLKTGIKATDGDGTYSAITTSAGFLTWCRTKATKAEMLAVSVYIHKNRAGRPIYQRINTGRITFSGANPS